MLEAKGILPRAMAGGILPEVCAPTILAVPKRNNGPTRHSYERRLSYHSFSLEIGRLGPRAIIGERRKRPIWPLGYVNFTQVIFRD